MDAKGVKPEDIKTIDDIKKLPFLTKNNLRDAYPYGLLGTDLKDCVRIQSTSGTTGKRIVAFYTQKDIDLWEECCARAIVAAGGTNEDVCQVCYGYGLFTGGPGVSFECEEQTGMHINEDHFYAEIIDPDTGDKEAFPLLRYRTRDLCVLTRKKCSCGRTHVKMSKPKGRSDDMLIIRGVNVFPSQIETVLLNEGYDPNYLIEVDRVNNTDTLDVNVEMNPEKTEDIAVQEKALASAMKTMLGINPKVHIVEPKSITRSEGKAVRVIDKRKLI